jgi:hypothetical protein
MPTTPRTSVWGPSQSCERDVTVSVDNARDANPSPNAHHIKYGLATGTLSDRCLCVDQGSREISLMRDCYTSQFELSRGASLYFHRCTLALAAFEGHGITRGVTRGL